MGLNRVQQRALVKSGKFLTFQEHNYILQTALNSAARDCFAVFAMCLRDKLGFGHERCKRLLNDIGAMFADVQAERLSIEDILKTLDEELNIQIK